MSGDGTATEAAGRQDGRREDGFTLPNDKGWWLCKRTVSDDYGHAYRITFEGGVPRHTNGTIVGEYDTERWYPLTVHGLDSPALGPSSPPPPPSLPEGWDWPEFVRDAERLMNRDTTTPSTRAHFASAAKLLHDILAGTRSAAEFSARPAASSPPPPSREREEWQAFAQAVAKEAADRLLKDGTSTASCLRQLHSDGEQGSDWFRLGIEEQVSLAVLRSAAEGGEGRREDGLWSAAVGETPTEKMIFRLIKAVYIGVNLHHEPDGWLRAEAGIRKRIEPIVREFEAALASERDAAQDGERRLRAAMSKVVAAVDNGSFASEKASIEFLEGCHDEVRLVVSGLKRDLSAAREAQAAAERRAEEAENVMREIESGYRGVISGASTALAGAGIMNTTLATGIRWLRERAEKAEAECAALRARPASLPPKERPDKAGSWLRHDVFGDRWRLFYIEDDQGGLWAGGKSLKEICTPGTRFFCLDDLFASPPASPAASDAMCRTDLYIDACCLGPIPWDDEPFGCRVQ